MGVLRLLSAGVNSAIKGANYVSTITIWLLMLVIIVAIVARLIGYPLSGITTLSEFMLVISIYFGVAYAQQRKEHVYLELLLNRLGTRARLMLSAAAWLVSLAICSVVVYTSWTYALESWGMRERMDGTPHFPIYPTKIAIAVGLSLLWLQLLSDLVGALSGLFSASKGKQ